MNIELININSSRPQSVRALLCQISLDIAAFERKDGLYFFRDQNKLISDIQDALEIARQNTVDLVAFPELSVPKNSLPILQDWSHSTGATIIGGTHYHYDTVKSCWYSRCPVIIAGTIHFVGKNTPSPYELSPVNGRGLSSYDRMCIFNNSPIGNFAVFICADYLSIQNRSEILRHNLDFIFIIAHQKQSNTYYTRISDDVLENHHGVYVLYVNGNSPGSSDGRSSFFGLMDNIFADELREVGLTNLEPQTKLVELSSELLNVTVDIDIDRKKPSVSRNVHTKPNVQIFSYKETKDKIGKQFIESISHDDERYRKINSLYVLPKEYSSIVKKLQKNKLVFIVGDPGIGKTYTAVHIMRKYYEDGYEPTWVPGLEKTERRFLRQKLEAYEPDLKQVIYFEDPFGRTEYESRDSLALVFGPLREKLKDVDSRVIITSRREIFDKFSREYPSLVEVDELKEEMSVISPSYSIDDLTELLHKLAEGRCKWFDETDGRKIAYEAIQCGHINTPFAIRDLVFSTLKLTNIEELSARIENRKSEALKVFSSEMVSAEPYTKLLLSLVFLYGFRARAEVAAWYTGAIQKLDSFGLSGRPPTFSQILRHEIGYRIEQYGSWKTGFRLTHPMYEESLWSLQKRDADFDDAIQSLISTIVNEDTSICLSGIRKCLIKYPQAALWMYGLAVKEVKRNLDIYNIAKTGMALISSYEVTLNKEFLMLLRNLITLDFLIQLINREESVNNLDMGLNLVADYTQKVCGNEDNEESHGKRLNLSSIFQMAENSGHPVQIINILESLHRLSYSYTEEYFFSRDNSQTIDLFSIIPANDRPRLLSILPRNDEFVKGVTLKLKEIWKECGGWRKKGRMVDVISAFFSDRNDSRNAIHIDDGAFKVLSSKSRDRSLLPCGIANVDGDFEAGSIVLLKNISGDILGAALTEYGADDLRVIRGHHSSQAYDLLGHSSIKGVVIRKKRYLMTT